MPLAVLLGAFIRGPKSDFSNSHDVKSIDRKSTYFAKPVIDKILLTTNDARKKYEHRGDVTTRKVSIDF